MTQTYTAPINRSSLELNSKKELKSISEITEIRQINLE